MAGYPHECTLTFETGADSVILQDSSVSLVMSSDVTISCPGIISMCPTLTVVVDCTMKNNLSPLYHLGGSVCDDVSRGEKTVAVSLPVVQPSSCHSLPLHLTFPSHTSPDMDTPKQYQVNAIRRGLLLDTLLPIPQMKPLHHDTNGMDVLISEVSRG